MPTDESHVSPDNTSRNNIEGAEKTQLNRIGRIHEFFSNMDAITKKLYIDVVLLACGTRGGNCELKNTI